MKAFKEYIAEYLVNNHTQKANSLSGVSSEFLEEYPVNKHIKIRKTSYLYNEYEELFNTAWGNHNPFNSIKNPTKSDFVSEISKSWGWKMTDETYLLHIAGYIWKRYGVKIISLKEYGKTDIEAHDQIVYLDPADEETQIWAPYSEYRTGYDIKMNGTIVTSVPELQKDEASKEFDSTKYASLLCDYIDDVFMKYKKY